MKSVQGKSWLFLLVVMITFSCKKQNGTNNIVQANIPTHPLNSEKDLDVLMQQIGDARIVLLGEASTVRPNIMNGERQYQNV